MTTPSFVVSGSRPASFTVQPSRLPQSPLRPPCPCNPPFVLMKLKVGSTVRVNQSVLMFHYPGKKGKSIDCDGFEGEIVRDKSVTRGVEMSAIAPYVVEFPDHPRFKAHFEERELEVLSEPEDEEEEAEKK